MTESESQESDDSESIDGDIDDPELSFAYPDERVWIDGIHLSPFNCPACLRRETFDCESCDFFNPVDCRLLRDPTFRGELKTLFAIYRERHLLQLRQRRALTRALQAELESYGRPLHYTLLARMIADRYPELNSNESSILRTMAMRPEQFECVGPGVYKLRA